MRIKTLRFYIFFIGLFFGWVSAYGATGEGDAWKIRAKQSLKRGAINMASAPLEVFVTVQECHEKTGYPLLRHTVGILEGGFRTVHRFYSGLWDFVSVLFPGKQKMIPLDPETLF